MSDGMMIPRKDLLALPVREWNKPSDYDSIMLVPTGRKHDSGWALIAIVGCDPAPCEIAAFCDAITIAPPNRLDVDMTFPGGVTHLWSMYRHRFRVGPSLSSTDVTVYDPKEAKR